MSSSSATARAWNAKQWLLVSVLLVAAILLRHHPYLSAEGVRIDNDWYSMHQTDALHVERALGEGALLTAWSPWLLGGTALFAVPTKAFCYPPFVAAVALCGPTLAMNLLLLAHLLLGSIGTVLLGRRLGMRGVAPLVCGLLFVLARFPASGFVSTPFGMGYAVAFWPYTLIALLDMSAGRRPRRAGLWLGTVLALQWLAGGEVSLYWLACFSLAFVLVLVVPLARASRTPAELRALAQAGLLAVLVFVGLIAVKLLPELAWLENSGRSLPLGLDFARDSALEEELTRSSHGSRLLLFGQILLTIFDGAGVWVLSIGCALGLVRATRARPTSGRRMWLALLAGTCLTYVLASGALHEWAYEFLPGYDRMRRHARFISVVGFGWILLAGFGFQFELRRLRLRSRVGLAAALIAAILFDTSSLPGVRYHVKHLTSAAERLELTRMQLAPVLAAPGPTRLQHPAHRLQPYWLALGIETTGGALGGPRSGNARYHELIAEFASSRELESDAAGALDVMGVDYIAAYGSLDFPQLELVASKADLPADVLRRMRRAGVKPIQLYRRPTARARACLVEAPTLIFGDELARRDWLAAVLRSQAFDAQTTVFVEFPGSRLEELTPAATEGFEMIIFVAQQPEDEALARWAGEQTGGVLHAGPAGDARWTRSSTGQITRVLPLAPERFAKTMTSISVDVAEIDASCLLLAELATLHDGWTAEVDGEAQQLWRADGLATFLRIPAGARRVTLSYAPPHIKLGAIISSGTLVLLVAGFVATRKRRGGSRSASSS